MSLDLGWGYMPPRQYGYRYCNECTFFRDGPMTCSRKQGVEHPVFGKSEQTDLKAEYARTYGTCGQVGELWRQA